MKPLSNACEEYCNLRLRANNAQTEGQYALAADLRLAIDALQRLEREAQLARNFRARLSAAR